MIKGMERGAVNALMCCYILDKEFFNYKVVSYERLDNGLSLGLVCEVCGHKKKLVIKRSKVYSLDCPNCRVRNYIGIELMPSGMIEYKLYSRYDYIKMKKAGR